MAILQGPITLIIVSAWHDIHQCQFILKEKVQHCFYLIIIFENELDVELVITKAQFLHGKATIWTI